MSEIKVSKPSEEQLAEMGVTEWGIWEKEASTFDWEYDQREVCYILEGKVKVTTPDGGEVEFGKGDLVEFPQGLKCTWTISEDVRKHYKFG